MRNSAHALGAGKDNFLDVLGSQHAPHNHSDFRVNPCCAVSESDSRQPVHPCPANILTLIKVEDCIVFHCFVKSRPKSLIIKLANVCTPFKHGWYQITICQMLAGMVSKTFQGWSLWASKVVSSSGHDQRGGWCGVEDIWGLTHDNMAQVKEIGRKNTAVFTLCLTEVANWLPNASIPPPFKTKERQLLVDEAPFTLWLQRDC